MKQSLDWEDLKVFLAVAKAGGLAGAATVTGISPATVGRRVAALEKSLDARLVERGARGYTLTEAGNDLLQYAQDMEHTAQSIETWRDGKSVHRRIRISAGDWTMRLLIDNANTFWSPDAGWIPEFLSDMRNRDIARRQVDIGIRNARPLQPWLAGQKVGSVEFAAYQLTRVPETTDIGWIGVVEDDANTPTANWLREHHADQTIMTVNKSSLALSLVRQGHARMLLPTFVGDAFQDLDKIGDPVEELKTERWLVMHQDERNEPIIRKAVTAISTLLKTGPLLNP
ncbi:MAG: LysR family transcriptional regulator [Roseibium sp.]